MNQPDGWSLTPSGWNVFPSINFDESLHLINSDLKNYELFDNIMILAGGLDYRGENHPWVKNRLDIVFKLYQLKRRKIFILGGGTYHKTPHLNAQGFVIHECTMGAKYLIELGVDCDDIYREWSSYDTIANAFFALSNFIIPMKLDRILIITSDFHLPRTRAIFDWLFKLWFQYHSMIQYDYLKVSTKLLQQDIIQARFEKEQQSLNHLQETIRTITTWEQFHRWFYTEHQAYNCHFKPPEPLNELTKASY